MACEAYVDQDDQVVLRMDEVTARCMLEVVDQVFEASDILPTQLRDVYLTLGIAMANFQP